MGGNWPHGPSPSPARAPSRVVAKQTVQTQVPAHGPSPKATDVATHCLVAVEPHHVLDRASANGVRLT